MEELWRFVLEGVSHELKDPANDEKYHCEYQERMRCDTKKEKHYRDHNHWNADRMQETVHRVPVTFCILRDPFVVRSFSYHWGANLQGLAIISNFMAGGKIVVYCDCFDGHLWAIMNYEKGIVLRSLTIDGDFLIEINEN
jgi:hypothetical protein